MHQFFEKIELALTDVLENHESRMGRMFGHFLVFLISLSILVFMLETTVLNQTWGWLFRYIDVGILSLFGIEYFLRFLIARKKLKFIFSPLGIIDLLVILPLFFIFTNIAFLRGFRLLRILQVLKIIRYSDVMLSFLKTFKHYKDELKIFWTTLVMVLILSSCGLYYLENGINPDFDSIPDSLWWAVVTASTLGYGDVVPMTFGGKFVASLIVVMGLATIAIMTALITKVFIDHFFGKRLHHCEYCHYPNHDHDAKFCKNCGEQLDTKKLHEAEHIGRKH